jgi:hypothetical protein
MCEKEIHFAKTAKAGAAEPPLDTPSGIEEYPGLPAEFRENHSGEARQGAA